MADFSSSQEFSQSKNLIYFEGINGVKQVKYCKNKFFFAKSVKMERQNQEAILNAEIEFFENFNSQNNIKKLKI